MWIARLREQNAIEFCLQAAQNDFRGEAIGCNETREAFPIVLGFRLLVSRHYFCSVLIAAMVSYSVAGPQSSASLSFWLSRS